MRRQRSGRGIMAMENENFQGGAGDGGDEASAAPESLETELLEVNDEEEAAAVDEAETDDAVEVAEALESLAFTLESAIKDKGGIDPVAAAIADQYTQSLYGRVGMTRNSMPALESFGGTSTRQRSTELALEDIGEAAKKIWDKIVDSIKKAIAWVKERFTKIFGAAEKLQKRAKALQEKAGSTTGTAKEKNFESERTVKALNIGGAVAGVPAAATKLAQIGNNIFGGVTTWNGKTGDDIIDLLDDPSKAATFQYTQLPQNLTALLTSAGQSHGDAGEGMQFRVSDELFGGQALVARVPSATVPNGEAAIEKLARTSVQMGAFNTKAKTPSKTTVATLSTGDCESIAKSVETLAEEIASYKRILDKLSATKEKIVAAAGKAQKAADNASDEDDKNERTSNKLLAKLGMAVPKLIDQPATSFAAYGLNTGKALLDYVELSLKQYESN